MPAAPGGWLTTVARRRAWTLVRRRATLHTRLPLLVEPGEQVGPEAALDRPDIPDDRLRLIFVCCHPTLTREAQVALTLRLLCGLSTPDVARAFLVSEPTMAARITRAKKRIAAQRVPYRVPPAAELPERLDAVLEVVHLLFTTGSTAPAGASTRGLYRARAATPCGAVPAQDAAQQVRVRVRVRGCRPAASSSRRCRAAYRACAPTVCARRSVPA